MPITGPCIALEDGFSDSGNGYIVDASSDYHVTLANSNYAAADIDYSQAHIFTDVNVLDPNPQADQTVQKFIPSTPVPSSMVLIGTGLVGLVPMIHRRKK